MYSGPIIDAHTHLWDLSMHRHGWLAPSAASRGAVGAPDKIRRDCLPEDYLRASAGQGVVASVHIEALWDRADPVGETRWLETLDKSHGVAVRYTAPAPLGTPGAAAVLAAQAAFPRVVGIRAVLSFHPAEPDKSFAAHGDIAADPAWQQDVARLVPLRLNLELMMYPYQLRPVLDLARSLPELQIIVNHCASPVDRDADGMRRWREAVRQLAAQPNIALKISNIMAYNPQATFDDKRGIVLHCIDCFGPRRTMFASDWPVAAIHTTFGGIYDSFRRITADLPAADQRAMFHDAARHFYRLD